MSSKELQLVNETGLTVEQTQQANKLVDLIPGLRKLATDIVTLEGRRANKYYVLCKQFRDAKIEIAPGERRTLNRREINLALQSLGFPKQRRTEINRIIECPDEVWAKLGDNMVTFREALKVTRQLESPKTPTTEGSGDEEGKEHDAQPEKSKPEEPKTNPLPKQWQDAISNAALCNPLAPDNKKSYLLSYLGADLLRYTVAIYVDKVSP